MLISLGQEEQRFFLFSANLPSHLIKKQCPLEDNEKTEGSREQK